MIGGMVSGASQLKQSAVKARLDRIHPWNGGWAEVELDLEGQGGFGMGERREKSPATKKDG